MGYEPVVIAAGIGAAAAWSANLITNLFGKHNADANSEATKQEKRDAATAQRISDWEESVSRDNDRLRNEGVEKDRRIRELDARISELERQLRDIRDHMLFMERQCPGQSRYPTTLVPLPPASPSLNAPPITTQGGS